MTAKSNDTFCIEWGYESLIKCAQDYYHCNVIDFQKKINDIYPISIKIIPYFPIRSPFGGGRPGDYSLDDIKPIVASLNKEKMGVSFVYNGGLLCDFMESNLDSIHNFLKDVSILSEYSRKYLVRNYVTLLRQELNQLVKRYSPEVETIASCITQVVDDPLYELSSILSSFDYCVLLNQNVSQCILSDYKEMIHRLCVFLFVNCGCQDLYQCYLHYVTMEKNKSGDKRTDLLIKKNNFSRRFSGNSNDKPILDRTDLFESILRMGVRFFKIPGKLGFQITPYQLDHIFRMMGRC